MTGCEWYVLPEYGTVGTVGCELLDVSVVGGICKPATAAITDESNMLFAYNLHKKTHILVFVKKITEDRDCGPMLPKFHLELAAMHSCTHTEHLSQKCKNRTRAHCSINTFLLYNHLNMLAYQL